MFSQKTLLIFSLFTLLFFFAVGNAAAENGFCSGVEVIMAGAHNNGKVVRLKNTRADCGNWPQNTEMWFYLDNIGSNASAMLAAAMAAQASGGKVLVVPKSAVNGGEYSGWSRLVAIYAQRP